MKMVLSLPFLLASISQLAFAGGEIDWGVFSVPVNERHFYCYEHLSNGFSLEFNLMPSLISENAFRANDQGIKLEHHFAYYFPNENENTCDYKKKLLEIASNNGGFLKVRLITFDSSYRKYTSISEYGVRSCVEDIHEKLRVEFPIGISAISKEDSFNRLNWGPCPEE